MSTYLLTWNPTKWHWATLPDDIAAVAQTGICHSRWSASTAKCFRPGDRVFLMKLGKPPRGVMAAGRVMSLAFPDAHWDGTGKMAWYAEIDFDALLDPAQALIFPVEALTAAIYRTISWAPRFSGRRLPEAVAEQLEKDWGEFLNRAQ